MTQKSPKLDSRTIVRIAALAGVDPRTAAKHALSDPTVPINPRGGSLVARDAVHRAAQQLGVRR
jgi:hypothetical protein